MGEFMRNHVPGIALLISFCGFMATVFLALLAKTYAKHEEVEDLKNRIITIETALNALPTVEQFHRVEMAVSDVSGDVKEIKSSINAIGRTTELLLENELKERK
ncbi:DUF2730 family protein [Rahnella contaminans]|uniref:DUF2730 family protein n=1 Tax=Rahnella contaminans TaxID=2703882 RepID=UPI003C2C1828